jgi:hypothetical protein
LSGNPKVIAVKTGMSIDDLCLKIIEEEQRLTEKNGAATTTVAISMTKITPSLTTATNQATLALRIRELDKET